MMDYVPIAVLIFHSTFMAIKIYLTSLHTTNAATANNYPSRIAIFQGVHGLLLLFPFLWVFDFFSLDILQVDFPIPITWLGLINYPFLILLMIWQMQSLSVNISASHDYRFITTSGPYQYVRHPLYLLFVLLMLNMYLISSNLIFVLATVVSYIASKIRADYEEQLLLQEHGEEYGQYKKQVPQLFPHWNQNYSSDTSNKLEKTDTSEKSNQLNNTDDRSK